MSSQSSLYSEKIFSEHPLGFWPLDGDISYLSLLGSQSNPSTWTITGATIAESASPISPISDANVYQVSGLDYALNSGQITLSSPNLFTFSQVDKDLGNLTVSTYFYAQYPAVNTVSLSLKYGATSQIKDFTSIAPGAWGLLSETFSIPEGYDASQVSVSLKISYDEDTTPGTEYNFFISGFATGQYAEDSSSRYLGALSETFYQPVAITSTSGIANPAYGLQDTPAYYVVSGKKTFARNTGIPLVFGANSSTTVYKNTSDPSIILPGFGFLNKMGQYQDLTFEAWLRLEANTDEPKRIIGPVASQDGLYVDGSFIILKIGNYSGSYFVSEWGKPMLIHIRVARNFASLLINGEQVISLNIITDNLTLPNQYDNFTSSNKKSQDWVGIYSHDGISSFKISSIAIYPYQVSEILAKRRLVYGQGVDFPDSARSSASGSIVYVDYPFAEYTNNYSYPDFGKWNQGTFDNVQIIGNTLSTPKYSLPQVFISNKQFQVSGITAAPSELTISVVGSSAPAVNDIVNISGVVVNNNNTSLYNLSNAKVTVSSSGSFKVANTTGIVATYVSGGIVTTTSKQTYDDLLESNQTTLPSGSNYWTLEPTSDWQNTNTYMLFDNLNILSNSIKAFYGVFEISTFSSATSVLFRVENEYNGNYFEIVVKNGNLEYAVSYGNLSRTVLYSTPVVAGIKFAAGINISEFAKKFANNLSAIFGDLGQIKMYVCGYKNISNKFTGKVYSFGFMTDKNLQESGLDLFDANFIADDADGLLGHKSSYKVYPSLYFDKLILDISSYSTWEDYLPLRYFAKYVKDATNNSYYDLDFMQFNISYPESPISGAVYDTESRRLRSYITFQPVSVTTGASATKTISSFSNIVPASSEGTVIPGDEWVNSAYEVVDGMIIYPPSSISVNNLAIATHIVMDNESSINRQINIRSLAYASESFDDLSPNMIGTRFGVSMYPYTRLGVYLDYKRKNPFTIYKGSTPYLYMSKNSGIRLRGKYGQPASRGIATPINKSQSAGYLLNAIQVAMRFDQSQFPQNALELFEIEGRDSQVRIYVEAINEARTRGRLYALDTVAGKIDSAVVFYINGIPVKNPVISLYDWNMLGIQFTGKLDLDQYSGEFRITGPALVNNISYYQYDQSRQAQTITFREWLNVLYSETSTLDWDYWDEPTINWRNVLYILSSKTYDTDLSQVYQRYMGTNKVIFNSGHGLLVNKYKYPVYRGITWQTSTVSPV